MICHARAALGLAAVFMFLDMALASAASAQDVMQLDLMFRESLLRKTAPEIQEDHRGGRQDIGAAQGAVTVTRHHPRPRRRNKA